MSLIKSKFKNQVDRNGKVVEIEVRKYQRSVFYNNLWDKDPALVKSRGAVFIGGNQVVYPMDKCFNFGENNTGVDLPKDTNIVAFKKLNGYMLNLTHVPNVGWIISTTGDASIVGNESTNDFINMGIEYIEKFEAFSYYMDLLHSQEDLMGSDMLTITFEVCHPNDPHIVVEEFGLHPICYQFNGRTSPLEVEGEPIKTTVQGILDAVKWVKHEGFMVYDTEGNLLFKLKSPYYLAKKWVQRGSEKRIWDQDYKERLDEEYYPIVKYIRAEVAKYGWSLMSEEEKSQVFIDAYNYTYQGAEDVG